MIKIAHYEVYIDKGAGWQLEDRFAAEQRQEAFGLAKEKEADIIVNKAAMGVLYAKPKYDLTQDVIEVVNKAAPKTNKK